MPGWLVSRRWTLASWLCLAVSICPVALAISGALNAGGGQWGFGPALVVLAAIFGAWLLAAAFAITALVRNEPSRGFAVTGLLFATACIVAALTTIRL